MRSYSFNHLSTPLVTHTHLLDRLGRLFDWVIGSKFEDMKRLDDIKKQLS